jgi:hypothetical protein
VACLVVDDCLVGPRVLPHRLTGHHYRDFLLHYLPELLEDVPMAVRARMWHIHGGAPAHLVLLCEMFSATTIMSHDQWIGREGPTA